MWPPAFLCLFVVEQTAPAAQRVELYRDVMLHAIRDQDATLRRCVRRDINRFERNAATLNDGIENVKHATRLHGRPQSRRVNGQLLEHLQSSSRALVRFA